MLDKSQPSQLLGINKDNSFKQPNTVTFALNAIKDSHDGGKPEYQSEAGNELTQNIASFESFNNILGTIYGQNNEIYIFSTDTFGNDEIGLFKEGNYQQLVITNFNFNLKYPITGEYRIRNGCDRVIYWCDGLNQDRWFNIDKPDLFKDNIGEFDPNKFKFTPSVLVPNVSLYQINDSGGNLECGSYYFQIEVLDKNENSIYKTDISPQTVIYNHSQSDAYNLIDGNLNYPQYDQQIGGIYPTNKSITLAFNNLDLSFKYLRVNIARQLAGTQVIDAHSIGELIPIVSDSMLWTYKGYDVNSGDYPIDYSEMLTDNIKYDSSYVQEQVQGRLLRANLKQDVRDYSAYQQYATEISVKWVSKEVSVNNAKEIGNPKNPETYWLGTSFQGDEVQALSVRYLHTDNTWSPWFHIPGRKAIAGNDFKLYTVIANNLTPTSDQVWLSDVEHLPLTNEYFEYINGTSYIGSQIRKWKFLNTATLTTANTTNHPYTYEGELGYYETNTFYPDIQDCDNNLIWGEDIVANVTKIRHHKMPDRKLIEHLAGPNGEYIQPLGLKFINITYPNSDVVGHQFGFGERTELNKTVYDSGWIAKSGILDGSLNSDGRFAHSNQTHNYARYNSAEIQFNKKLYNVDYVKINKAYRAESNLGPSLGINNYPSYDAVFGSNNGRVRVAMYHMNKKNQGNVSRTNYKILKQIYLPQLTNADNSNFSIPIKNTNKLTNDSAIEFSYGLPSLNPLFGPELLGQIDNAIQYKLNNLYVYKKKNNIPFANLFTINYKYINFNPNYAIDDDANVYYNGDTIICQNNVFREQYLTSNLGDHIDWYDGLHYEHFWEEHQFNTSLRHEGLSFESKYYKGDFNNEYLLYKMGDINTDNRYVIKPNNQWRYEGYTYNKDYDKQLIQQNKEQLPFNYDFCSKCRGVYTNRIIFSPKSFDEENFDLYRINKVNDYIDMPGHRGAIKGLKYQNNQLLVICEDSTFILQPNPQQISTDQNTAYLTTGDFLSIPPQELIQTDTGFAGCQSKQHQCATPNGFCWTDQKRGEVFKFSNQIELLTGGLTQWFKENLSSETKKDTYQIFQQNYPNISTVDPLGVGLIMYYDPRFKRLIISKKDFKPINYQSRATNPGEVTYEFALDKWFKVNITNGTYVEVVYGNPTNFENKSWTLSYSFENQSWISWHSYKPVIAFNDDSNYYTVPLTQYGNYSIWRHKHKEKYQNYYDVKYDFIIEWMIFDINTFSLDSLHYTGYTLQWDSTNKKWKEINDTTFNKFISYNYNQSTGLQSLILQDQYNNPYQNISLTSGSKYVIKTDQNYKISGLYDMAINKPVMSNDWNLIKTYPGYIDEVPLTANIDFNKSPYDMGNIQDKFVINRLFFKPSNDYKKVIILSVTNEQQSVR